MPVSMRQFIFWSGIYNTGLAFFLLFPPLYRAVGLNIPAPLWGWLLAGFLGFTSAVLILASRDLRHRASLVYWDICSTCPRNSAYPITPCFATAASETGLVDKVNTFQRTDCD